MANLITDSATSSHSILAESTEELSGNIQSVICSFTSPIQEDIQNFFAIAVYRKSSFVLSIFEDLS